MLNWSFRALNLPIQVILLISILQAIPIYHLSGMVCPKKTCENMVCLFKKLLWKGSQEKRKWALLSWDKLTLPKLKGGLGLRDLFTLNQVMGVNLWWRWLQGGVALWRCIWERKYHMPLTVKERLNCLNIQKGSGIWNLAAANRHLIRIHSFWEIRDGNLAGFWEDSWQQREKLFTRLDLAEIFLFTRNPQSKEVKNYWEDHND